MKRKIVKERGRETDFEIQFRMTKRFSFVYGTIIGGFIAILLTDFMSSQHIGNYLLVTFSVWLGLSLVIAVIWLRITTLKIYFKQLKKIK